jgi:unsaturated chondroitin disaccharide hydrolase
VGIQDYDKIPRSISSGKRDWTYVPYRDWTSGFWPGILWYVYEYTGDEKWKLKADSSTRVLTPLAFSRAGDHDLGFQIYNSFGNGYRLTGDSSYKRILLAAADTLVTLFNPKVGTILSWPGQVKKSGWPHNTIIDNMMNLELLFWASKNGGSKSLYDIAVKHAETTMNNHFRADFSSYHVVVYDTISGKKINAVTHQGFADSSMWARGQAWAIYGFTMCYRETNIPAFLDMAQKAADVYLNKLPADMIPYWDFSAATIADQPRDASAAAITASGLLELSTFGPEKEKGAFYLGKAEAMLKALSSHKFRSGSTNNAFILHSTGHKNIGSEVDASIIYGDYYYLEALIRAKRLREGKGIYNKAH